MQTIKLNSWLPKRNKQTLQLVLFLLLSCCCCLIKHLECQQPSSKPISTNEIPHSSLSTHPEAPILAPRANFSQFSREVTNISLSPDYRSIKLRWSYKFDHANQPASFRIRYCELTSWNAEIKCRHREMRVRLPEVDDDGGPRKFVNDATATRATCPPTTGLGPIVATNHSNNSSVIQQQQQSQIGDQSSSSSSPPPSVHRSGFDFETQIYDLRALTNYTFNIQVSRFLCEPTEPTRLGDPSPVANRYQHLKQATRANVARRLDGFSPNDNSNNINNRLEPGLSMARIETKPFGAEASRCFANSSEILVNTGRYFGGRISVEGQSDPRCQMLGNKSSDQSVYLFQIDHQVCQSKTVDGDRIETMILVHENKDILTHNTARFLVLCSVQQKSFTVKASVSLPKINSLAPNSANQIHNNNNNNNHNHHRQPATITRIKPAELINGLGEQVLRIGSMPGIYRPTSRIGQQQQPESTGATTPSTLTGNDNYQPTITKPTGGNSNSNELDNLMSSSNSSQLGAEDPMNSMPSSGSRTITSGASRRSKKLSTMSSDFILPPVIASSSITARQSNQMGASSLRLAEPIASGQLQAAGKAAIVASPTPVEVSSGLLFVDHATQATNVRHAKLLTLKHHELDEEARTRSQQVDVTTAATTRATPMKTTMSKQRAGKSSSIPKQMHAINVDDDGDDDDDNDDLEDDRNILMTNNHRVADSYVPLPLIGTQANPNASRDDIGDSAYSIKYSTARVNAYSMGRALDTGQVNQPVVASTEGPRVMATSRARSGRMRMLHANDSSLSSAMTTSTTMTASNRLQQPVLVDRATLARKLLASGQLESRMGDSPLGNGASTQQQQPDLIVAESQLNARQSSEQPTLAGVGFNQTGAGGQNTLAQNITGALLRWSLRALGNLAKKSLESLVDESELTSSTTSAGGGGDTDGDDETGTSPSVRGELAYTSRTSDHQTRQLNQQVVMSKQQTPKTLPARPSETIAQPIIETTKPMAAITPTKPSSADQERRFDGFEVSATSSHNNNNNNNSVAKKPETIDQPAGRIPESQKHARPSEYSKSLRDSPNRSGESHLVSGQQTTSAAAATATTTATRHHQRPTATTSLSKEQSSLFATRPNHESDPISDNSTKERTISQDLIQNRRSTSGASWLLYGLWAAIGLVMLASVAIYLIFVSSFRLYNTDLGSVAGGCASNGFEERNRNSDGEDSISANKSGTLSDNLVYGRHQQQRHHHDHYHRSSPSERQINSPMGSPPSTRSDRTTSTRSTSASSSLVAGPERENFCRNSEFVYTDHVLIKAHHLDGLNESFA